MNMGSGITMFTDLITGTQITGLLGNLAIVFGGIIAIMVVLSPVLLAKKGFSFILSKVSSVFGGK
jgi:hypothetical protein